MALSITSLLQTESLDPAAQSKQLFEDTFRRYSREFPVQAREESTLALIKRFNLHCIDFMMDFISQTTDEKFLQSTGNSIADQFYGDRRNGMGILEEATKDRRQLREIRETMQEAQRLIKLSVAAPPPQPVERTIAEPIRYIAPSESSSRSSISVSTGIFSTTASQPSTAASQHFSHHRLSMSPDPPPARHDVMAINSSINSTQNRDVMTIDSSVNQDHDEDQSDDSNDDDFMNSPDDEPENTREWSYEALKHRGKGRYICPEWRTCTKGGNNGHGSPKIFKRNCMFRQHLQKHDKPHKCLIKGCPNKEGFARKDQLLRHQQNVKHEESPPPMRFPYHMRRL